MTGGSRPCPVIFACLFSLSLQQVIGDRCIVDWLGYKSPDQPEDGRALVIPAFGYRWSLDSDWILDTRWIVDCRRRRLFCVCDLRLTLHYIFGFDSQH